MREILFKAQRSDGKGWVEGIPVQGENRNVTRLFEYINIYEDYEYDEISACAPYQEIIPGTICQFTGRINKFNDRIFEGDKFEDDKNDEVVYSVVVWNNEKSKFTIDDYGYAIHYGESSQEIESDKIRLIDRDVCDVEDMEYFKITGSIHDKN